jgi:hypothetical protein
LAEAKKKGKVTVNAFVALELARGLNTLPARCDLDKHTFFLDSNRVVKCDEFFSLGLGCLLVKGEASVYFGRDTAGNDGEDLFAKFDELRFHVSGDSLVNCQKTHKAVNSGIDLLMDRATLLLAVRDCDIDYAGVCGFVHRSEYQRRICCRILWLVNPQL